MDGTEVFFVHRKQVNFSPERLPQGRRHRQLAQPGRKSGKRRHQHQTGNQPSGFLIFSIHATLDIFWLAISQLEMRHRRSG